GRIAAGAGRRAPSRACPGSPAPASAAPRPRSWRPRRPRTAASLTPGPARCRRCPSSRGCGSGA
ncbi:unnamed protein product, partial [Prorocentrum cordatum]